MAALGNGASFATSGIYQPPPSSLVFNTYRSNYRSPITKIHPQRQLLVPVASLSGTTKTTSTTGTANSSNDPSPPTSSSIPLSEQQQDKYSSIDTSSKDVDDAYSSSSGVVVEAAGGTDGTGGSNPLSSDYFRVSKELVVGSNNDGGPPRWFSLWPVARAPPGAPVLLFLPGLHGVGTGLIKQMNGLSEVFNVWCLHIPLSDRTPFTELVKLVEETVRAERSRSPRATTPIYLVGESFGGCLALAVASRNPHLHLILILANPATCFGKSQVHALLPLSEIMMLPQQLNPALIYFLSLASGLPWRMAMDAIQKGLPLQQTFGELAETSTSYLSVLADLLSAETLNWKLKLLKSAAEYANSRLHAVKARTLILSSGRDALLPSQEEAERLTRLLPNCEIRMFRSSGHTLFLEDGFDLMTVIKGASFYQRGRTLDYVWDYLPPKPCEFNRIYEPHRWTEVAWNPVMLSTLENGKIVRGLGGIPSQGPVVFVGYHMMLGLELIPLVARFWTERRIVLRGIAHPLAFTKKMKDGKLPDPSTYDAFRSMGAVPASPTNFYKLFSSKSHVLLYPGGMREALHRKGEEHKLIWPQQSEFVRMAARFGAKIVPFGAVGEDDFGQLVFDYDDLVKIPYFKAAIEELTQEAKKLRSDAVGELGNQDIHLPILAPKLPGRLYFFFGKPIETEGRKQELKNREAAQQVYVQVKSEVESRIAYLKRKRESDPYRNLLARLSFQAFHGFHSEVPTFHL